MIITLFYLFFIRKIYNSLRNLPLPLIVILLLFTGSYSTKTFAEEWPGYAQVQKQLQQTALSIKDEKERAVYIKAVNLAGSKLSSAIVQEKIDKFVMPFVSTFIEYSIDKRPLTSSQKKLFSEEKKLNMSRLVAKNVRHHLESNMIKYQTFLNTKMPRCQSSLIKDGLNLNAHLRGAVGGNESSLPNSAVCLADKLNFVPMFTNDLQEIALLLDDILNLEIEILLSEHGSQNH